MYFSVSHQTEKQNVLKVSLIFSPLCFCSPCFSLQWFCESAALNTDDFLERQKVYKFRGDLAVRQGNYQVNEISAFGLPSLPLYTHEPPAEFIQTLLEQTGLVA